MRHEFDARIEEGRGGGAWVAVPLDVEKNFGTRGQVRIIATFDGEPYRGSIVPMGGGQHILGITKAIRQAVGKDIGDRVHVVLERDAEERTVELPDDLAGELKANSAARKAFEKLSYTRRREIVRALEEAKKPETRKRRLEVALKTLAG